MAEEFGNLLKSWRGMRRFSQLELSGEAEMSARHLSFLETGRSKPSRNMVMRLAGVLQMPRGVTNQALHAAGFAAVYPSLSEDAPELEPVRRAMSIMLENHAPYPGIAIDRHWNVVEANAGAAMLMSIISPNRQANLGQILLDAADSGLIENWEEVALLSVARLRTEILLHGGDDTLSALVEKIMELERYKNADISAVNFESVVIPTIFCLGELRLSVFSTIAEFGSVQDIRAGEIRIELMFPADEATREYFGAH